MTSTEETRALRDATRRLVRATTPRTADEHVEQTSAPLDRTAWLAMAERLGLQAVRVPEELGGTGLGLEEQLLVHEEMGRALYGGPFVPVVGQVVPALLGLADDEPVRAMVRQISAGKLIVVPAFARWYDRNASLPVLRDGDNLSGVVPTVLEGLDVDAWLVPALDGDEPVIALVLAGDQHSMVTPLPSADLTRRFADVEFSGASATVLARGARALEAMEALETGAVLALSAESVGIAAEALAMTIDYVKVREQFGQVIGSFQSIKHQVSELFVLLESARSALAGAVDAVDQATAMRTASLAVARRRCGSTGFRIANEAIHLHGGIGFTWEHRIHLYYRRAKTNEVLLDERGTQARVLAASVSELYAHGNGIGRVP
ncbi:acyl-CoA dehydrogenase family protein [Aeromicrobium panaciterrae]|uniref:acyl-CoA dehydrogenase family protein n=1 Tax=Aeromicrobium panaciterrae TaxID=363861 RepID=UPI0031D44B0B